MIYLIVSLIVLLFVIAYLYTFHVKDSYIIKNVSYPVCDSYYFQYKILYDTVDTKIFNDNDVRDKLFPVFKSVYPSLKDEDCILDIGSNIGEITDMFNKYYPGNRIFLAEPLELNCKVTIEKFKSKTHITTIHTAIGYNRNIIWRYNGAGDMMGVGRRMSAENVTFMSLDMFYNNYAKKGDVFFLKIDVEGYEDEVLFTGKKLLESGKVKYLYFEYHRYNKLYCKTSCSSIVVFLEGLGYHCYLVGKYKMIKITSGCFMEMDSQKLAHVIGIKDSIDKEEKFIRIYYKNYMNSTNHKNYFV